LPESTYVAASPCWWNVSPESAPPTESTSDVLSSALSVGHRTKDSASVGWSRKKAESKTEAVHCGEGEPADGPSS
jgi:hypothetical protein